MSVEMTREERRALDDYIASQRGFQGMAEEAVTEMIVIWLRRNLPGLLRRISIAAQNVWDVVRDWLGF